MFVHLETHLVCQNMTQERCFPGAKKAGHDGHGQPLLLRRPRSGLSVLEQIQPRQLVPRHDLSTAAGSGVHVVHCPAPKDAVEWTPRMKDSDVVV